LRGLLVDNDINHKAEEGSEAVHGQVSPPLPFEGEAMDQRAGTPGRSLPIFKMKAFARSGRPDHSRLHQGW
jgi:hypothetical protein